LVRKLQDKLNVKNSQNKTWHLLVACNDVILESVVSNVLKEAGYKVTTAKDGLEVLFTIKTFQITQIPLSLLVLDSELPNLNCPNLIERLDNLDSNIHTILISSPEKKIKNQFLANRNISFMEKPFSIEQLLNMIHEVLP